VGHVPAKLRDEERLVKPEHAARAREFRRLVGTLRPS